MKNIARFPRIAALVAFVALIASAAAAQSSEYPAPRESRLLNGTRLLVWAEPGAPKVSVKIRIHSGAAFDPAGKEGVMQLLSDIMFRGETTREFFREDLGGSFDTKTTFDYIEIAATGDNDKLLTIMETLSNAITNPQIDKEATARVKQALAVRVAAMEKEPRYVVGRLAAKRLFGGYPYGRAPFGTSESVAKIDFADLLDADARFFTADNATIAIAGDVNPDNVLRAAKRLFGAWLKSDKKIPATFAQPAAPDARPLKVETADAPSDFAATAKTAPSRNDKDYWAAEIAVRVARKRSCGAGDELAYDAHLLKGVIAASRGASEMPTCGLTAPLGDDAAAEAEAVRQSLLADLKGRLSKRAGLADFWLDVETFRLVSLKEELARLEKVTFADVMRVSAALAQQPGVAVVLVKTAPTAAVPSN